MTTATSRTESPSTKKTGSTRALLAGGVIAGPLFLGTILIQQATRAGVDSKTQPLSLLSNGEAGWIQITNFIVCGLLVLGSAIGIRRRLTSGLGRTWGPILIGVYGFALVWGGVFVADPAMGFPVGTPEGAPDVSTWSWHSILHTFASPMMMIALAAACFVLARRFLREGKRNLAIFTWVWVGLFMVLSGFGSGSGNFQIVLVAAAMVWLGASFYTATLLKEPADSNQALARPT